MLTHCNAGWLATVDWGTALAGVYAAHDAGVPVHVWVDETRPRNQGAALTAWELGAHGVPHTVIVDNAGGHLMQRGQVDVVLVGTDRTTAAGDVVNKIGTYLKALAARDCGVPFYVAAPVAFDRLDDPRRARRHPDRGARRRRGDDGRRARTASGAATRVRIAPDGSRAHNPGFDVTPARLVTGIVTERGVARGVARRAGAAVPGARRGRRRDDAATLTAGRARRAIVDTVRWLMARRLYSGNVRQRLRARRRRAAHHADGRAVRRRRRGVDRRAMTDWTASRAARLPPSSEWRIHRDIYRRRPEVGAVVHTHSTFATALSVPAPARSPRSTTWSPRRAATTSAARATRPTAPRRCRATRSPRSTAAAPACSPTTACVALGADLASARLLAEEIEALCAQYILARVAGTPVILPAREMKRVRAKFATYGRKTSSKTSS